MESSTAIAERLDETGFLDFLNRFVADVTGHGYFAYLLASGLPALWQRCWNAQSRRPPEPVALLACMHDLLCESMPEGIFLECTLVRLTSDGLATVVPAGGTRVVLRRGSRRPDLLKLRGAWLGLQLRHHLRG